MNEVLREVIADELSHLDDEHLALVTVTGVSVEPDLRHATVWLSSLSDDAEAALGRLRPRLQAAISRQLRLKRTPELAFKVDPAVVSGERVDAIIRRLQHGKDEK